MSPPSQYSQSKERPRETLQGYINPTTGIYSLLPVPVTPYAQLLRLHNLPGYLFFYYPYLNGALYGSLTASPPTPPKALLSALTVLAACMFFLRASALILNDILDRKFDAKVPRTRLRPLARGAITPLQGYMWIVVHVLCFIAVTWAGLPEQCLRLSIPHVLLQAAYQPAKRFTDFTPFVIGPAWAFGLFVGAAAVGTDPFRGVPWLQSWSGEGGSTAGEGHAALWCLAAAYACWGVVFESVYAHQDIGSDEAAGVKSIALRFREKTKGMVVGPVAALQIALLASAGLGMGAGALYYMVACGAVGGSLGWMIWKVDLSVPDDCLSFFKNNCWYVGGGMAVGLATEYGAKTLESGYRISLGRSFI